MMLIDANAILRFVLYDNEVMANEVCALLENTLVTVRYEVLAEVVYVLAKVYSIPKTEISDSIHKFIRLPNVGIESTDAVSLALETYADKNIDFVDCLLYGYNKARGYDVFTFDKKLKAMINR